MSLLKISEGADPNYLATVVKVPTIKPHPNADKLELLEIFGNTIVVGKGSYTEGELVVYFAVESAICAKFLSWANLFDKPELNQDQLTKGYFQSKGRVRAVALRGIPSQGFLFKVSELSKYFETQTNFFKVGETFDTVGSEVLVTKYIKGTEKETNTATKKTRVPKWIEATIGVLPRPMRRRCYIGVNYLFNKKSEGIKSQLVEGQFKFHYKTEHLGKNIHVVKPDDYITITSKFHGTSAIYANILCKKRFSIIDYLWNLLIGHDTPTEEYKFVYSSRSVLKNRRDGTLTDDVWGIIASEIRDEIPEGFTVYGEIVGYTASGKTIQKGYDYGCRPNECDFRVYRITENMGKDGIRELEWSEIEEFCYSRGMRTVPMYYTGPAEELFPIPLNKDWQDTFLNKLKESYLDLPCRECTNDVVAEGIVLRIESSPNKSAFKFKSPKFLLKETEERDNDETNIEDES